MHFILMRQNVETNSSVMIKNEFSIDVEPKNYNGDEAEDGDQNYVAQGVARLSDAKENVTQGTVVSKLPEARETAHLK